MPTDTERLDWILKMFNECEYTTHYSSWLPIPDDREDVDSAMEEQQRSAAAIDAALADVKS